MLWVVIVFSLPETLRARVGNGDIYTDKSWVAFPPKLSSILVSEKERGPPPRKPTLKGYWKLFRYPPIGITCVNTAILYSSYFCIAIQLPTALGTLYHWPSSVLGAGYIVVGVAMVIGSVSGGHFSDWRYKRLTETLGESNFHPEARLNDQIWGLILASTGLIMFGFFVEYMLHPAATLISTFLGEWCFPNTKYARILFLTRHGYSWIWNVMDVRCLELILDIMSCTASGWGFRFRQHFAQSGCGGGSGHHRASCAENGLGILFSWAWGSKSGWNRDYADRSANAIRSMGEGKTIERDIMNTWKEIWIF